MDYVDGWRPVARETDARAMPSLGHLAGASYAGAVNERRACARGAWILCAWPFLGDAMCVRGDCAYKPRFLVFRCARARYRERTDEASEDERSRVSPEYVERVMGRCEDVFAVTVSASDGTVTAEVAAGPRVRARVLLYASTLVDGHGKSLGLVFLEAREGLREAPPACDCCFSS